MPGNLQRRPRRPAPGAAYHDRALGLAARGPLGGRARACPGSRPARSSSCRGRSPRARAPSRVSSTSCLSGNPAWSNAHAIFIVASTASSMTPPVSSAYSCAASSAAPSTPARGPWRARRIFVCAPAPGTAWRRAPPRAPGRAGARRPRRRRRRSRPRAGRTSLIALAIPIPSRSPRIRRQRIERLVALARAVDGVVPGHAAVARRAAGRGTSSASARAAVLARAGRARGPEASPSSEPACGNSPVVRRRAVGEVEPDHRVADLGRRAGRAAVEPPVEHEPAADAGADREHHQVRARHPAVVGTPRPAPRTTRRCRRTPAARRARSAARAAARPRAGCSRSSGSGRSRTRSATARRSRPRACRSVRASLDRRRSAGRRACPGSPSSVCSRCDSVSSPASSVAAAILVPPTSMPMNWSLIAPAAARRRGSTVSGRARAHARQVGSIGSASPNARRTASRLVLAGDQEDHVARRALIAGSGERDPRHQRLHARPPGTPTTSRSVTSFSGRFGNSDASVRVRPEAEQHAGRSAGRRRAARAAAS